MPGGAETARLARPVPVRLADAQWLVARDLGFDSWPALKTHVDALVLVARAIPILLRAMSRAHPALALRQ